MLYLVGGNLTLTDVSQFFVLETALVEIYPDGTGTYRLVEEFRHAHDFMFQARRSPFVAQHDTFDSRGLGAGARARLRFLPGPRVQELEGQAC